MKANESWFARGKAEAEEGIPFGERVVGIAIVVFSALLIMFFGTHQRRSTGFFTAAFGTTEMLLLYGWLMLGIISAGLEGVFGLRLYSRLFDIFGGLILAAVCIIGLLVVFPFDFVNFADVLPDSLRFLVQWISNDIARVLMVLAIIVYLGAAIFTPIAYKFVDIKRFKREKTSE
jgi:hypothetical protein